MEAESCQMEPVVVTMTDRDQHEHCHDELYGCDDELHKQYPGQHIPCELIASDDRYEWTPQYDVSSEVYEKHLEDSQYMRDFVLGLNDGIVSTLVVVSTVVGGGGSSTLALAAAIITAVAGCFAMGAGEWIATRSQAQVTEANLRLEQEEHFLLHRDVEVMQVYNTFREIGLSGHLLNAVVNKVCESDETLLNAMKVWEFPQADTTMRNPVTAMFISGRVFLLGSLPSILPFLLPDPLTGLGVALGISLAVLLGFGAWCRRLARGSWWQGAIDNLMLAGGAVGISYGIGVAFDRIATAVTAKS